MSYQEFRPSRFQLLPLVIKNLIIINVIFFLAKLVLLKQFNFDLTNYLGLHYFESPLFRPYQFITYLFMHGGDNFQVESWAHIFFNMFALWMFGNILENVWGPRRFLIFYLVTGIGAGMIYMLYQWYNIHQLDEAISFYASAPSYIDFTAILNKHFPLALNYPPVQDFLNSWDLNPADNSTYIHQSLLLLNQIMEQVKNTATVGASGSVYGVLLGFGMLFPNMSVYFIFIPFPIKAKYMVFLYGGIEVYAAIQNNPGDNVAHLAHLGGMLFAFALIKMWNKKNRQHFY